MTIGREEFEKAIEDLADEERRMHLAITMEASNKLSNVAKKLLEMLKGGKKNFVDLHCETFEMATREQLEEALQFLIETNQIRQSGDDNNVAIYERRELE